MENHLKEQFHLQSDITFLNHGSFGACPKPILSRAWEWQQEMERQPVEFFQRRASSLLNGARTALGSYVNTHHNNVVFVSNATVASNIVSHSINLKEGDEVLATDHEYGAVDRTWRFWGKEHGFSYKQCAIPFGTSNKDMIELLWKAVTNKTKVIAVSHMTSPTATIFPIKEICKRAAERGIITVIDGAHAPGHIPIDLTETSPDFYFGNLHKWLCAPKGSAFLYVNPKLQSLVKPLIVSWGYEAIDPGPSQMLDYLEFVGTRDLSPFLTTSTAIEFADRNNWSDIRKRCHEMAIYCEKEFLKITKLESIYDSTDRYAQMVAMRLPRGIDPLSFKQKIIEEFKIEVPVYLWNNNPIIRVSLQGYNTLADVETFLSALKKLLG